MITKKELKQYKYPSELINAWLVSHNFKQTWLAKAMRRPEKTISEILSNETAITAQTALQLQDITGIKAKYILQLQNNLDLDRAIQDNTNV